MGVACVSCVACLACVRCRCQPPHVWDAKANKCLIDPRTTPAPRGGLLLLLVDCWLLQRALVRHLLLAACGRLYGGERIGGWVCTRVTPCLCCTHRTRRHGVTRVHTEHTIVCLHSSTRDRACEEARARTDNSGCMLAYMTIRM